MRPALIFFDIDDTLYRKDRAFVPPSVAQAWQALRAQGVAIAIATGRPPTDFPPQINDLIQRFGVELIISMNGQYVRHGDAVLRNALLDAAVVADLVQLCREKRLDYAFISEEGMFASSARPKIADALHLIGRFRVEPDYHRRRPMQQMLVFVDAAEEALLRADARFPQHYQMIRWHPHSVDFLSGGASKAQGIRAACAALNIDPRDTMAFGDGLNDVEMFAAVGLAVAMGDAVPELKARAHHITGRIEDDGIWQALRHFHII